MNPCKIFITGIPTAGKSYLAKKLAEAVNGTAVNMDDYRESLALDERYKKWVNFYLDQNEEKYIATTSPDEMWKNLVAQSEALWPAFLEKIADYENSEKPIVFECVNLLPHLTHRDLPFPGIALIGRSYEEILNRNKKEPRWSSDPKLQESEAKMFFEIERPRYESEAKKYGYPIFETANEAFEPTLRLIKNPAAEPTGYGRNGRSGHSATEKKLPKVTPRQSRGELGGLKNN